MECTFNYTQATWEFRKRVLTYQLYSYSIHSPCSFCCSVLLFLSTTSWFIYVSHLFLLSPHTCIHPVPFYVSFVLSLDQHYAFIHWYADVPNASWPTSCPSSVPTAARNITAITIIYAAAIMLQTTHITNISHIFGSFYLTALTQLRERERDDRPCSHCCSHARWSLLHSHISRRWAWVDVCRGRNSASQNGSTEEPVRDGRSCSMHRNAQVVQ